MTDRISVRREIARALFSYNTPYNTPGPTTTVDDWFGHAAAVVAALSAVGLPIATLDAQANGEAVATSVPYTHDRLRSCRICGFTIDLMYEPDKPDPGMWGGRPHVRAAQEPSALGPDNPLCDHAHYSFEKHGRLCTCGTWMVDFGD